MDTKLESSTLKKAMDQRKISLITVKQLLTHLRDALDSNELLMKEVWEQCEGAEQFVYAENELRETVRYLEERRVALERVEEKEEPTFKWNNMGRECGFIRASKDSNGLQTLEIHVREDHYSGILPHEQLFGLLTSLINSEG